MTDAERLSEAKAALHSLNIGTSVRVLVDQNGERIEYTAANRKALTQYISQLEESAGNHSGRPGGPLRFFL